MVVVVAAAVETILHGISLRCFNQAKWAHNDRYIQLRPNEKNQEQTRAYHLRAHLAQRSDGIYINDAPKSKQEMDGTQEIPLSNYIKQSQFMTEKQETILTNDNINNNITKHV
jgi:hypothetical protein